MDGGGFAVNVPASDYGGRLTFSMIVTCVVAASGGLIFGYDVGVSGNNNYLKAHKMLGNFDFLKNVYILE